MGMLRETERHKKEEKEKRGGETKGLRRDEEALKFHPDSSWRSMGPRFCLIFVDSGPRLPRSIMLQEDTRSRYSRFQNITVLI